jgi:hypothetical protein
VTTYLLPSNVYFCVTDDGAVFLDLAKGKYIGASPTAMPALRRLLQEEPMDNDAAQSLEQLLQHGLLTRDQSIGKRFAAVTLPAADEVLINIDTGASPKVSVAHVHAFLRAYSSASVALRWQSIASAVHRVERRKRIAITRGSVFDEPRARTLLRVFKHLRPYLYSARDRCLLDSLAIVEFMAHYNLFPTWVLGVRTGPFSAHSWVQHERYVLNGDPSYTGAFTPILAV